MMKRRILAFIILLVGVAGAFFVFSKKPVNVPFKLGLDLSGGVIITYNIDTSSLGSADIKDSLNALRDVIERRVNLFGVSEPVVRVEKTSLGGGVAEQRLVVELAGVTNVDEAIKIIGQTPTLEFKSERPDGAEKDKLIKKFEEAQKLVSEGKPVTFAVEDPYYISTSLTGRYLQKARLDFDNITGRPIVSLKFNSEGGNLFKKITSENVGKVLAIYLDGAPISTPVIREAITGGEAQITGDFSIEEAKTLVGRLNSGALPVPINLISRETIGPSLGKEAVSAGINAAMMGFILICIFLIAWYRLPGILASLALLIYAIAMLSLFKIIPVVLTAAGIAGFIVSMGIAVDANILIFERMKEEIKAGKTVLEGARAGADRAWTSIRDSNLSTIITAFILFWFSTSLIKGFALTLGLGVLMSMVSALVVTKSFIFSIAPAKTNKFIKFIFGSGLS